MSELVPTDSAMKRFNLVDYNYKIWTPSPPLEPVKGRTENLVIIDDHNLKNMPTFDLEELNYELSRLNHKLGFEWPYPDAKEYILLLGEDEYNILDKLCTTGYDNTVRNEEGQIVEMFGFPIFRVNRQSYLKAIYNPSVSVTVTPSPPTEKQPEPVKFQGVKDLEEIWRDPKGWTE